jgi:2-dehydro-3-deoxyphosphogluconate aldolase / (4S)-4-hydroxy-2-oxoglutarate aldolase
MNRMDMLKQLTDIGIIPIIRTPDMKKAGLAADALRHAGLGVLEISLSVGNGLEILENLAGRLGNTMLLGAGTVRDAVTARNAVSAGARFIVSPGTSDAVIEACRQLSTVVCPGALTPTEIMHAWQSGADAIKVFPCDAAGGPHYIRAISAPLPDIVLLPCGGVNHQNAADYFAAGAAALFVGSSLIPVAMPDPQFSEAVEKSALQFMQIAQKARTARQ